MQSVLGIHEYYAHGVLKVPNSWPSHSIAYQKQYEHKKTFDKLPEWRKLQINKMRKLKNGQ